MDFYTGKYFTGGLIIMIEAPYERVALFIEEASIIPAGPDLQFVK